MSGGAYGGNRLNRGPQGSSGPVGYLGNGYDYGSPAGAGGTDGGGTVVAQWTFEEASGDAIDAVGGISVPAAGTIPRQMITPQFKLNSSGAGIDGIRFTSTTDHAALAPGTSSFVLESSCIKNCWVESPSEHFLVDTRDGGATSGMALSIFYDGTINFYITATDGSTATAVWVSAWTTRTLPTDGILKFRISVNRAVSPATAVCVYNGTTLATKTLTAITTLKSIGSTGVNLGGRYDVNRGLFGILKEVRLITGTTTANSGGPGGG